MSDGMHTKVLNTPPHVALKPLRKPPVQRQLAGKGWINESI